MFKKFKGKFKDILGKSQEETFDKEELNQQQIQELEEKLEEIQEETKENQQNQNNTENKQEQQTENNEEKEQKKGFLSKIFSKKQENEEENKEEEQNNNNIENENEKLNQQQIQELEEKLEEIQEETKKNQQNQNNTENNEEKEKTNTLTNNIKNTKINKTKLQETLEIKEEKYKTQDTIKTEQKETLKTIEKQIEENKKQTSTPQETTNSNDEETEKKQENPENEKKSFLSRTFGKLKTKTINQNDFDRIWLELEIFLLEINVAYDIVEQIKEKLKNNIINKEFTRFKLRTTIKETLIHEISQILKSKEQNFLEKINNFNLKPIKIIILGINGTGKTTTLAKLVNYFEKNNLKTVVSASDTFRAAAVEQLEEHSKKLGFKLIKHSKGSDSVAVAFDAIKHAQTKEKDIVLIDTAGRMSNDSNLIKELQKMERVIKPDLTLIIGDSNSGNDLKNQIEQFNESLNIDGIILTKVDTDEKPGSIVTTAYTINKPIYFLGTGQNYEDLEIFESEKIAKHLFDDE